MKTTRINVFMGDDTLTTETKDGRSVDVFDRVLLDKMADSDEKTGPLAVSVARVHKKQSRGEKKDGYLLEGNCLVLEDDDLLDADSIEAVNKRLADECGEIGAVRGDDDSTDETESGSPVSLTYVANHNGLRLVYNKAIRNVFRVRQGRQSVATAIQRYSDRLDPALKWALAEKRLELVADQAACIAAYEATLK